MEKQLQVLALTVPWVGLQPVIVVYPDHTHFLKRRSVHTLNKIYWSYSVPKNNIFHEILETTVLTHIR